MSMFDGETLATSASQGGGTATASPDKEEDKDASAVGVILDSTALYSEAVGQVSDCGRLLISGDDDGGDAAVTGVVEVADVGRLLSGR